MGSQYTDGMSAERSGPDHPDRAAMMAELLPRTPAEPGRSPFARVVPDPDGEPEPEPPEPGRRGLLSRMYRREL